MMKINEIDMSFQSNNDGNLNDLPSEINHSESKNWYKTSVPFPYDDITITTAEYRAI